MSVPRFWRKLKNIYNLIGTRCGRCGEYFFPPRILCPNCRKKGIIVPYKFRGKGKVITYTIIHSPAKGFNSQKPYILAIIKLDEGPCLTSQIVGPCEDIHIGMRVKPVFRKLGEESEKGIIYYGTKFVPDK